MSRIGHSPLGTGRGDFFNGITWLMEHGYSEERAHYISHANECDPKLEERSLDCEICSCVPPGDWKDTRTSVDRCIKDWDGRFQLKYTAFHWRKERTWLECDQEISVCLGCKKVRHTTHPLKIKIDLPGVTKLELKNAIIDLQKSTPGKSFGKRRFYDPKDWVRAVVFHRDLRLYANDRYGVDDWICNTWSYGNTGSPHYGFCQDCIAKRIETVKEIVNAYRTKVAAKNLAGTSFRAINPNFFGRSEEVPCPCPA